jgi:hypothetical protein
MVKSERTTDIQYGALPYRFGPQGPEIVLITSRAHSVPNFGQFQEKHENNA